MTDAEPRALFELGKSLHCTWDNLEKADHEADRAERDLLELLTKQVGEKFASEDANVVVFGSLARKEWIDYVSDLDWTYLIDGQAKSPHLKISHDIYTALHSVYRDVLSKEGQKSREYRFGEPGPSGTFGNMGFSHELVHRIGGRMTQTRTPHKGSCCSWNPSRLGLRVLTIVSYVASSRGILKRNHTYW